MHAFVAMPFGEKEGVNFDRVYEDYIKPALEGAGFDVLRADEEAHAGWIHTDMFEELLLADLVVVDLSINNPNVWYELGVRHALRSGGVVHVQAGREYLPFDASPSRALEYHVSGGVPDPAALESDKQALAKFARETMAVRHQKRVSPVYHLVPFLEEPEWRKLRVGGGERMWREFQAWAARVEVARRTDQPGDIMVLAGEAPTLKLKLEARQQAGKALMSLGQFDLALEQFEAALEVDPGDLVSRQQKGVALGRMGQRDRAKYEEARVWLEAVSQDHPKDAETLGLLGRVAKDAWTGTWRRPGSSPDQRRAVAAAEEALLRAAIDAYAEGFAKNPADYYPGINAVTFLHLHEHLTGEVYMAEERPAMEGAVRWAVHAAIERHRKDYWARATLGDYEVLMGEPAVIKRAYNDAVVLADNDWFKLDSTRQQLLLLEELGFRPDEVRSGIEILDRALARLRPPFEPRQVLLFSGHMIDQPDRPEPRFPADKEPVAAGAIAEKLDELGAGQGDLAISGAACGGDLLFAEECLRRGVRLQVYLPREEPGFLDESVNFAGESWRDRYYAVKGNPLTEVLVMPERLGPCPKGTSHHVRNNEWLLNTALSQGPERLHFICLWNGGGGDGPGGTKHMVETVRLRSGRVHVLDTTQLW